MRRLAAFVAALFIAVGIAFAPGHALAPKSALAYATCGGTLVGTPDHQPITVGVSPGHVVNLDIWLKQYARYGTQWCWQVEFDVDTYNAISYYDINASAYCDGGNRITQETYSSTNVSSVTVATGWFTKCSYVTYADDAAGAGSTVDIESAVQVKYPDTMVCYLNTGPCR